MKLNKNFQDIELMEVRGGNSDTLPCGPVTMFGDPFDPEFCKKRTETRPEYDHGPSLYLQTVD